MFYTTQNNEKNRDSETGSNFDTILKEVMWELSSELQRSGMFIKIDQQ